MNKILILLLWASSLSAQQTFLNPTDLYGCSGIFNGQMYAPGGAVFSQGFDGSAVLPQGNNCLGGVVIYPSLPNATPPNARATIYLSGIASRDTAVLSFGFYVSKRGQPITGPGKFVRNMKVSLGMLAGISKRIYVDMAWDPANLPSTDDLLKVVLIRETDNYVGDVFVGGILIEFVPTRMVSGPDYYARVAGKEEPIRATNMLGQAIPLDSKGIKILWMDSGNHKKVYEL